MSRDGTLMQHRMARSPTQRPDADRPGALVSASAPASRRPFAVLAILAWSSGDTGDDGATAVKLRDRRVRPATWRLSRVVKKSSRRAGSALNRLIPDHANREGERQLQRPRALRAQNHLWQAIQPLDCP